MVPHGAPFPEAPDGAPSMSPRPTLAQAMDRRLAQFAAAVLVTVGAAELLGQGPARADYAAGMSIQPSGLINRTPGKMPSRLRSCSASSRLLTNAPGR